jgi:hypothetical protein
VKTKAMSLPAGGLDSPPLKACANGAMVSSPKSGIPSSASAWGRCPFLGLRRSEEAFLACFEAAAEPAIADVASPRALAIGTHTRAGVTPIPVALGSLPRRRAAREDWSPQYAYPQAASAKAVF